MHKVDHNTAISLDIPASVSVSTNISANTTPPPPLTGSGQSPQSSSLPSTNTSTVGEPVQTLATSKQPTVEEVSIAS
jgi:hypothetical protein